MEFNDFLKNAVKRCKNIKSTEQKDLEYKFITKQINDNLRQDKVNKILKRMKNRAKNTIPIDHSPDFAFDQDGKRKDRSDKGSKRSGYCTKLPDKYKSYVQRANRKRIEFNFTIDEFNQITSSPCVYCGRSGKNGIDRIDSAGGYTHENTVPCCYDCNMMKYTKDQEEFIKHIKRIYKHLNLDGQTKLII